MPNHLSPALEPPLPHFECQKPRLWQMAMTICRQLSVLSLWFPLASGRAAHFLGLKSDRRGLMISEPKSLLVGVSINMATPNGWFIRVNPIKMDDLGVPLF